MTNDYDYDYIGVWWVNYNCISLLSVVVVPSSDGECCWYCDIPAGWQFCKLMPACLPCTPVWGVSLLMVSTFYHILMVDPCTATGHQTKSSQPGIYWKWILQTDTAHISGPADSVWQIFIIFTHYLMRGFSQDHNICSLVRMISLLINEWLKNISTLFA